MRNYISKSAINCFKKIAHSLYPSLARALVITGEKPLSFQAGTNGRVPRPLEQTLVTAGKGL